MSPPTSFHRLALLGLLASSALPIAHAATIVQMGTDGFGQSSFNTGDRWSDLTAPTAANDYITGITTGVATGKTLRTPSAGGNRTFAGNSLTLTNAGTLGFKGTATTDIITINDLRLETGSNISNATTLSTFILAGNISIASSNTGKFTFDGANGGITVSAAITGGGALRIATTTLSLTAYTIALTHADNTYFGGTTIDNFASLTVRADGALGTGDVTFNGGRLAFEGGSSHNYISDSASLLVAAGLSSGSVALSFTGIDVVGGLSLNGGSTFLADGIYTAAQLNALYGSNLFSGDGQLSVGAIPEPSTFAMLAGLGTLGFVISRRNRCASRK